MYAFMLAYILNSFVSIGHNHLFLFLSLYSRQKCNSCNIDKILSLNAKIWTIWFFYETAFTFLYLINITAWLNSNTIFNAIDISCKQRCMGGRCKLHPPVFWRYHIKLLYINQGSKGIKQWPINWFTYHHDDIQNYPFFRLQLLVEMFGHLT